MAVTGKWGIDPQRSARRRPAVALLAALALFGAGVVCGGGVQAAAAAHGLPPPVVPDGFGVNIHFTRAPAATWRALAASGFRFVRMDMTWQVVQPFYAPDYAWRSTGYDSLVRHLRDLGMRPIFILDYCNPLFPSVATAAGRQAFARFAAAAAHHFRGDGVIWELWNEPNGGFWQCTGGPPNAEQYVALARAAAAAMRRANPNAFIIGPAEAGYDPRWTEAVTRAGLLPALDAFSLHPYRFSAPDTAAPDFDALHAWLAAHPVRGGPLPIVSSEWGYNTLQVDRALQADYLVRMFLGNLQSGIHLSIWYDWQNDCTSPTNGQCHYGVVVPRGNQAPLPKPAYRAMQTLARTLGGYGYAPQTDGDGCPSGLRTVRLVRGPDAAQAFWSTGNREVASLYVGTRQVTLISQYGAERRAATPGGVLAETPFRRSVTYVLDGAGAVQPPPAPQGLARLHTWQLIALQGASGTAAASLTADVFGAPLTWRGLCGVQAYLVYTAPAGAHGTHGPWRLAARVTSPYWPGPAPRGPTAYAVRAVGPTGVQGPLSATLVLSN
jgi:hypothetical protein